MLKRTSRWVSLLAVIGFILAGCSSEEAGTVVAKVNGEEISREDYEKELEITKSAYAQQGVNLDDLDKQAVEELESSVLDQLINTQLVLQTSKDEGMVVKESEINTELDTIKSQFEDDKKFEAALKEMDLTEATLKEQVKTQLTITKYVESQIGKINVTDEEVKALYDQYKQQTESQDQKAEPFESIKPQLEQQVIAQKRNEEASVVIGELRKANEDNIEILL